MAKHDLDDPFTGPTVSAASMSLRDYFAAAVMPEVLRIYAADNKCGIATDHLLRNAPAHAYRIADAMLSERQKAGA